MKRRRLSPYTALAVIAASGLAACVGEITTPAGSGVEGDPAGGSTTEVACQGKICVGTTHLSRLTRDQYRNSVQQLLGDAVEVDVQYLPQDQLAAGIFKTTEISPVSAPDIDKYSTVAESLAEAAPVAELVPCEIANGDQSCVEAFLDEILPRAYRRDITAEERAEYLELYQWSVDGGDGFEDAIRLLLATMLQSPHFLYRMEQGGSAPRKLSGREVAVRLAYFLWRKAPSAELTAAAVAGELDSPDGIETWAREMMASSEFDDTIREFAREWLGIGDVAQAAVDQERFPDFSPELARSMLEETERFTLDVFRKGDGRQETLLGAEYSLVDDELAQLYGLPAPSASGFSRVDVPGRAGVLTHASVLTTFSSASYTTPIFRGIFVRKRILCQSLKPRPDNVDELIKQLEPSLKPDLDDRERLTALTGKEPCIGCHKLTNPIGFAFESFDAIGKSRTKDYSGATIDTSSGLDGGSPEYATDVDGDYSGAVELSQALASSEDVAKCMSLQWLRFSLGYDAEGDDTSRNAAYAKYAASQHDLRELVVAVVLSDAFRYRVMPSIP